MQRKIVAYSLVALVIIIVITIVVSSQKPLSTEEFKSKLREFQVKCNNICKSFKKTGSLEDAVTLCSTRLFPPGTIAKLEDPAKVDIIKAGENNCNNSIACYYSISAMPLCEDGIFCLHLYVCGEYDNISLLQDCRKILCEYFRRKYNDATLASKKVIEIMQANVTHPWGSCELPKDNNWWYKYFGDEPCTNPP